MPLDPLATVLQKLLEEGSLPASNIARTTLSAIDVLFQTGILGYERSGSGRRVRALRLPDLRRFAENRFPSGLDGIPQVEGLPRAVAVANLRDAKRAGRADALPVMLRGRHGTMLYRNADRLDIGALTASAGVAAIVVSATCTWSFVGRLALIENVEAFLHSDRLGLDVELAIYSPGPTAGLVLDWLSGPAMEEASFVFAKDYDPSALADYVRVRERLGARATLHIPRNLADLVRTYGKQKLINDSADRLVQLRSCELPDVRVVIDILDRYSRGLEQEFLLLPTTPVAPTDN